MAVLQGGGGWAQGQVRPSAPEGELASSSNTSSQSGSLEGRTPLAKPAARTGKIFGLKMDSARKGSRPDSASVGELHRCAEAARSRPLRPCPWPGLLARLPGPCLCPFVLKLVGQDPSLAQEVLWVCFPSCSGTC